MVPAYPSVLFTGRSEVPLPNETYHMPFNAFTCRLLVVRMMIVILQLYCNLQFAMTTTACVNIQGYVEAAEHFK